MRAEKPQRPWKEAAGSRHEPGLVRQTATATAEPIGPQTQALMEEVLRRENLLKALRRVQSNKGAPGVDGMRVEDLPDCGLITCNIAWAMNRSRTVGMPSIRVPPPGLGNCTSRTGDGT